VPADGHGDLLDWLYERGKQRARRVPEFDVERTISRAYAARDAGAVNFWSVLSPAERSAFESAARKQVFAPGTALMREGEQADAVMVILDGRAKVCLDEAVAYARERHTFGKPLIANQVVRHRLFSFRGVIFDIDPEFNNTEEWYQSIPAEVRPHKDQPFYHLFAENAESEYIAYVSEQNLLPDTSGEPVRHPQVAEVFEQDEKGSYRPRNSLLN